MVTSDYNESDISQPTTQSSLSKGQVRYASIVAFLAWTFAVYDYVLFGTLLPAIGEDFGWSTPFTSLVATLVSIVVIIAALTVGPITDYLGRRMAMMVTVAGAALSSGLTALTFSAPYLVGVRTISGLGYSEQAVNSTYLSEILPPKRRGTIYGLVQMGWPVGALIAAGVSSALLPSVGWRGIFAIATAPALIIIALRIKLRESPRYEAFQRTRKLMKAGQQDAARAYAKEHGIDPEKSSQVSYFQLLKGNERKRTVWLSISFFFYWMNVQVIIVLGSLVLTAGKHMSLANALIFLILGNAIAAVGYAFWGFAGDRLGRRNAIALAWAIGGILVAVTFLVATGDIAVLVLYMAASFFIQGGVSAFFSYVGESYPTRVRGTGVAFVNAIGPVGALAGSGLFTGLQYMGMSVTVAAVVTGTPTAILAALALLRTRNIAPGQELEDITT